MQQVFSFGNVDLVHDAKNNVINMVYKGFTKSADFRTACEKALEIIKLHRSNKMLVDQRKMGVMATEDIVWLANDYYPRSYAILRGHMKTALVLPESAFGEMSVKKITGEFDKVLTAKFDNKGIDSEMTRNFPTVEAAQAWLLAS
jgi:hypothetical protein